MEKNCLYCGTDFSTNRESKKYCSDKCKQMAYLTRNGLVRVHLAGLEDAPAAVKAVTDVAHVNTVNAVNDVKAVNHAADVKSVKDDLITATDLEALLARFTEAVNYKIENAVMGMKQELAAVTQKLNAVSEPEQQISKPLCDVQPLESLMPKVAMIEQVEEEETPEEKQTQPEEEPLEDQEENNDTFEEEEYEQENLSDQPETIAYMDYPEEEEKNNEEPAEDRNNEKEELLQKLNAVTAAAQKELEQQDAYAFVRSEFLKEVERYDMMGQGGLIFRRPPPHWNRISFNCVAWINYRLRCLIECLLKISNCTSTDRDSIQLLSKAFVKLIKSESFEHLPPDYPYTNFIEELAVKLSKATGKGYANEIQLKFTREKRALLITIRKQLAECVPAVKFSELDFYEHPGLFMTPTKAEPTEETTKQAA